MNDAPISRSIELNRDGIGLRAAQRMDQFGLF
jgi:hypothetical protein